VSVGSNIIMSGILGAVFFGEAVSMPWVIGIVLIVGGLLMVHQEPAPTKGD
jgi:multidrug transporter EmrE-like cation transporter